MIVFFSLFLISHHAGKLFFSITRMITRITILIARKMFSSCHERGTKKKFWVPMRSRPSDLLIPRSHAPPLNYRDSTVRMGHYVVHMTRVVHTASRISNVDSVTFVDRNKRSCRYHLLLQFPGNCYRSLSKQISKCFPHAPFEYWASVIYRHTDV